MKFVILKIPVGIGGAEVSLNEMSEELQALGHEVFTYYDFGDSKNIIEFNKFGAIKERLDIDIQNYSEELCIDKLKKADAVVMLHRNLYSFRLAEACNKVSLKIVYVPGKNKHHVSGTNKAEDSTPLIKNINYYIFNSMYAMTLHLNDNQHLKNKFRHIHPPINFTRYNIQKVYNHSDLNVAMFGRLIPSKRPAIALDLIKKQNKFRLSFIGDGPLRDELTSKIKKENIMANITGMLNNPFVELQKSTVVVHLCDHESMSRALREAMILKVPVLAINRAGNKELLCGLDELLIEDSSLVEAMLKFKSLSYREDVANKCYNQIITKELAAKEKFKAFIESL